MIDRKTGSISLSATCQVKAGDAFNTVLGLLVGEVLEVADKQNGWKWLTGKNLYVDGNYVIISFGFYADSLNLIELTVSKGRFGLIAGWDSWPEQNELVILKDLRSWLMNELGREGEFAWGNVRSAYDPKSGSSSISIRYQ